MMLLHDPFDKSERELVSRFWEFIDNNLSSFNTGDNMGQQPLVLDGEGEPATEKQLWKLKQLKVVVQDNITKKQASDLIKSRLEGK